MKIVITQLMLNIEHDECTTRHTNSKTGDVDEGINFMACQIANGDGDVVFEHSILQIGGAQSAERYRSAFLMCLIKAIEAPRFYHVVLQCVMKNRVKRGF
jgi:hypothetical protein